MGKYYSQAGQDKWVVESVTNHKKNGYFVDIGAYDGIYLSNSYLLEKDLKWTGICVEADAETFKRLAKNRKCECINACIGNEGETIDFTAGLEVYSGMNPQTHEGVDKYIQNQKIIRIQNRSLKSILDEKNAPAEIDYLSVDVEGMEWQVIKSFPFYERKFLCATIERPCYQTREILKTNGYLLVVDQPGLDAFYIHESLSEFYLLNIIDKSKKRCSRIELIKQFLNFKS